MSGDLKIRHEAHYGDRVVKCFSERETNLYRWFHAVVARNPSADALVFRGATLTFAEFDVEIRRVAHGLVRLGIGSGDRLVLFVGNRPENIAVLYAAMRIGAVVVPVDIRLQGPEVAYIAGNCGASALVFDAALRERVPAVADLPSGCHMVEVPHVDSGRILFADVPAGADAEVYASGREEDLALIVYTSGTTGRPKGAMLSHFNIIHSCLHFHWNEDITAADRIGVVTPITHVTGLIMGVICAVQAGAAVLLLETFKARLFLEMAATQRMTQTVMVPAMYSLCLLDEEFDRFDLSAWRLGNYGGAPMLEATILALAGKLPNLTLINGYGSTETASPAAMLRPGEGLSRPAFIGRALPCADIRIVDPDGVEVPRGESGEIWIAGPMVAKGYWNNPEATAAGFTGGYWHSGDIGSMDEDGYIRILDRMKDVVNRGGYKIYGAEVENVLADFEGVLESAVVGRADSVLGERVHAFVTVTNTSILADALRAFCASRLADYKVPETFTISTEPLPRSSNGKLLKRDLRERAAAGV